MGEQNSLVSKKMGLRSLDTLIASAALFETLFNKRTIGQRDENSTTILNDSLMDDYLFEKLDFETNEYVAQKYKNVPEEQRD